MAQKKPQEALAGLNQLISLSPDLLSGYMVMGQAYTQVNDRGECPGSLLREVVEITRASYGPGYLALGDLYFQTKDDEKKLPRLIERPVSWPPRPREWLPAIGLHSVGKTKELRRSFEDWPPKRLNWPPRSYFAGYLGVGLCSAGKNKQGLEKLKEASKLLPQDPVISYHLGRGLL